MRYPDPLAALPTRRLRRGSVCEMEALELLVRDAVAGHRLDELAPLAVAWALLGWSSQSLVWVVAEGFTNKVPDKRDAQACELLGHALRGRRRARLRAMGLGVVATLEALEHVGALSERGMRERQSAWWHERAAA